MRCPKCHNEVSDDSLTCDFCLAVLPMSDERAKKIKKNKKLEKKLKLQNSLTKLIGLLIGLFIIVGIVVVMYLLRK